MGFKRPRSVRDQDDGDSSDSSLEVFSPDEWRRNSSNLTTPSVEPKPVLKMQRQSPTASTPRQRQSTGVKKEYREEPARPHHAKLEPPSSPRPGRETSSRSSRSKRKGKEKEKDPAASESSSDWLSRIERYSKLTDEAVSCLTSCYASEIALTRLDTTARDYFSVIVRGGESETGKARHGGFGVELAAGGRLSAHRQGHPQRFPAQGGEVDHLSAPERLRE